MAAVTTASGAPARVLLVDDEESVLLTLEAVLRQEGYEVKAVGSGSDALRALQRDSYDLLLTDLRIDEIDGLTLLAAAQKRDPETISILLTGYASLESAVQALRHGAFNYLLKPCNIDEMKLTIARGLEKKRLAEALRERVIDLEDANRTIQSFNKQLEDKVSEATAQLAERVRELQQSQGRLTAVIDSMQDGLVVYDGERRVVRANTYLLNLFGLPSSGIAGLTSSEVARLTGEPPHHEVQLSPASGNATEGVVFELDGARKRFIRRMLSPVEGDGSLSDGLVAVYQDISDQKEVEQLKDDFLSIASHELKTPLTSIMGYTQLLNRRLTGEARHAGSDDIIDVIEAQCRRMKRLVEDLLDVSRIERGTLQTAQARVNLEQMIRALADKFEKTSPKHDFRVETPGRPVIIWGDPDRLEQVLDNLLSNAVKYSPDGGPIDTKLKVVEDRAEVSVRDRGIGIPAEQQARIFSRFYQAESVVRSRRFGGMGLGLFISKSIIDEMGGSIGVESTVGEGSIFHFELPIYKG